MEVSSLPPETRHYLQEYLLRRHTQGNPGWRPNHRGRYIGCYEGMQLVVWQATEDLPTIIDRLTVKGLRATFAHGITVDLFSEALNRKLLASCLPNEIYPRTFVWVPSFFETRFAPTNIEDPETTWRMTMMLALQAAGPRPRLGEISISTTKEFRNLWPELK